MELEALIHKFAEDEKIIAGICDVAPLDEIRKILEFVKTPFVTNDISRRITPKMIMENAESMIVIGVGYDKIFEFPLDNAIRGNLSVSAVGIDYHVSVKEKLLKLMNLLNKHENFEYKIFVDNGDLVERELAKKSGIGYYGKNCNIISNRFGSFFNIGYALISLKLGSSKSQYDQKSCGNCQVCITSCPTRALSAYHCDYTKCISYLTQKKGDLTEQEMKSIGFQIYGCDVCQRVCPKNFEKAIGRINDINLVKVELSEILNMTNKEFNDRYKQTSAGWRGKKTLQRNAMVVRDNYGDTVSRKLDNNSR